MAMCVGCSCRVCWFPFRYITPENRYSLKKKKRFFPFCPFYFIYFHLGFFYFWPSLSVPLSLYVFLHLFRSMRFLLIVIITIIPCIYSNSNGFHTIDVTWKVNESSSLNGFRFDFVFFSKTWFVFDESGIRI